MRAQNEMEAGSPRSQLFSECLSLSVSSLVYRVGAAMTSSL